ncbi:MAG: lipoyl synthase [Planctomycetota bacterium]|nr:MAG: lipoyl synthase [Planctomycetota bacterium]
MAVVPISDSRERLPKWFKRPLNRKSHSAHTNEVLRREGLVTVCEEAACPNRHECYSKRVATFMLMGDTCTRTCTFCDVKTGKRGEIDPLDPTEPQRVARAVGELGLDFVVLTSVNRDDIPGGGSEHFAATIAALREQNPAGLVEVLTPDFCGDWQAVDTVIDARPDVFNHNMETIPRLYRSVRPQAQYQRSLDLLQRVKQRDPEIWTKSGIMVGLGETDAEIRVLMEDLRAHGVDIFTVGQYLRPSLKHHDIMRFVEPEQFRVYEQWGKELGFSYVASGPYIRSSYFAEEVLKGALDLRKMRAAQQTAG